MTVSFETARPDRKARVFQGTTSGSTSCDQATAWVNANVKRFSEVRDTPRRDGSAVSCGSVLG